MGENLQKHHQNLKCAVDSHTNEHDSSLYFLTLCRCPYPYTPSIDRKAFDELQGCMLQTKQTKRKYIPHLKMKYKLKLGNERTISNDNRFISKEKYIKNAK